MPDPIRDAWHPIARSEDVGDAPQSRSLLGSSLVVFRDRSGRAAVLHDRCPHRGTRLSLGTVADGYLSCPYHGWQFDADGRCVRIPSLRAGVPVPSGADATSIAVCETDGMVWATLGHPTAPPPGFPGPSPTERRVRIIRGEPMMWSTSAGRHLENILDLAHFPFVHPATFGCPEAELVEDHEVQLSDEGRITCEVGVTTRNPSLADGSAMYPDLGPTIRLGYRYTVELPYRITLEFSFPDGMYRALHEVINPDAHDRCTIHWLLVVDAALGSSDDEERAFAAQVFSEDQPIIESQPPGVPVDRRAEIHVPADRLAVAYRRALCKAGLPAGARA